MRPEWDAGIGGPDTLFWSFPSAVQFRWLLWGPAEESQ